MERDLLPFERTLQINISSSSEAFPNPIVHSRGAFQVFNYKARLKTLHISRAQFNVN